MLLYVYIYNSLLLYIYIYICIQYTYKCTDKTIEMYIHLLTHIWYYVNEL